MCCWSSVVVVLVFGIKSRKRGTEFGAMLDLVHKKTVLKICDVGKVFCILCIHSLYCIQLWCFLKVIFLRAQFWSFCNVVMFHYFFWPHNCVPYCKCDSNSEWYAVFNIWKFAFIGGLHLFWFQKLVPMCLNLEGEHHLCQTKPSFSNNQSLGKSQNII